MSPLQFLCGLLFLNRSPLFASSTFLNHFQRAVNQYHDTNLFLCFSQRLIVMLELSYRSRSTYQKPMVRSVIKLNGKMLTNNPNFVISCLVSDLFFYKKQRRKAIDNNVYPKWKKAFKFDFQFIGNTAIQD